LAERGDSGGSIVVSEKTDWHGGLGFSGITRDKIAGEGRIGTTGRLDAKRLISQIAVLGAVFGMV
jgi:hypothetical protein